MTDDSRLEAIETKIAHLEQAAQELSDVVYRQQKQIDNVLAANRRLGQQIAILDARVPNPEGINELPPHY
jgi:uncharacterized coiled-coil protein SlyX